MSKREIIRQFFVPLEIYDLNLPKSICKCLAEDMPKLDNNVVSGLDIVFDKNVYQKEEFYRYPITKEHKGPQPKTQQEKRKQIIYDVLSEQLAKVVVAAEELGIQFGNTAIIGDNTEDTRIRIILYKTEPIEQPKGKKQANIRVNSIVPDRPYVTEQAAKALAEFFLREIREGKIKESAKQNHTANWVEADKLFQTIAESLYLESTDVEAAKLKLIREALVECDWPLRMRSRTRNDTAKPITGETKIDCPEYLLFCLTNGGSWDMKEIEGLQAAQQFIVKYGYRSKRIKSIVVLHHEKAIPYTLLAETAEGLVYITPEEAHGYKKIFVSWDKMK